MQEDFRSFYVYWTENGESYRERVYGRSSAGAYYRMKTAHPNAVDMHVGPYYEERSLSDYNYWGRKNG